MKIRLGTRGSALALAQTAWVEARLRELHPGLQTERVVIATSGDRFSQAPPVEAARLMAGDGKGLFVKEIEEALQQGRVDLGVHSAKDLPASLPEGLIIAAYPPRESPRDVLVSKEGGDLASLPSGARVASSSLRRQVQLLMLRPDLKCVPMRGNVDTRLRKLQSGECEALVLAAAGLKRLGRDVGGHVLEEMVPAPGQGALALEARAADTATSDLLGRLDDPKTRTEVEAERLFLRIMEGGCRMPLGALAELEGGWLRLSVFWSPSEGGRPVKLTARSKSEPVKVAQAVEELARRVRELASIS